MSCGQPTPEKIIDAFTARSIYQLCPRCESLIVVRSNCVIAAASLHKPGSYEANLDKVIAEADKLFRWVVQGIRL